MGEEGEYVVNSLAGFILLLIIVTAIVEIIFFGVSYYYADTVECNFLWCEFKTTNSNMETHITTSHNHECYLNGVRTDCDGILDTDTGIKKLYNVTIHDINHNTSIITMDSNGIS